MFGVCCNRRSFILSLLLIILTSCGEGGGDSNVDNTITDGLPRGITASHMLDVDTDGDLDILIASSGFQGRTADMLLLNNANGVFTINEGAIPDHYLGNEGSTVNFTSADFNGDGHLDIIATTVDARDATFYQSGQIHLYLGGGNGVFTDATANIVGSLLTEWPEWIRSGDFDLDGNTDFIVTISGCSSPITATDPGNCIGGRIYLNDGSGNFSPAIITSTDVRPDGAQPRTYVFDKLVWQNYSGGGLRVALDLFVGDVDNDGKLDIVAPNGYAEGAIATFINNSTPGNLNFTILYTYQLDKENPPYGTTRIKNGALLDIDNDGYLDMVGSMSISEIDGDTTPVHAFINQGDGSFVEDNTIFSPSQPGVEHARQWLVDDFNQDGFSDLLVADHGWDYDPHPGQLNLLLLNNGLGSLSDVSASNLNDASTYTHGASTGDVNGDSYPDLFLNNDQGVGTSSGGEEMLWLNNGDGSFSPVSTILQ